MKNMPIYQVWKENMPWDVDGIIFLQLIGMHLPGKNSLYFSQSLNFLAPCHIDDEITIEGEVIDKSPSTRMITLKTSIYNQSGICLIEGIAKVIVRENTLNNQ